jgi:hypothetical protein
VRVFLTFTLTRPAVVYVCYDKRLRAKPVWLLYFKRLPGATVKTSECDFEVWEKVNTMRHYYELNTRMP